MAKIRVISNGGAGFVEEVEVGDKSIADIFFERFPDKSPNDFLIRINGAAEPPTGSYKFADGDKLSITPTKQEFGRVTQ